MIGTLHLAGTDAVHPDVVFSELHGPRFGRRNDAAFCGSVVGEFPDPAQRHRAGDVDDGSGILLVHVRDYRPGAVECSEEFHFQNVTDNSDLLFDEGTALAAGAPSGAVDKSVDPSVLLIDAFDRLFHRFVVGDVHGISVIRMKIEDHGDPALVLDFPGNGSAQIPVSARYNDDCIFFHFRFSPSKPQAFNSVLCKMYSCS